MGCSSSQIPSDTELGRLFMQCGGSRYMLRYRFADIYNSIPIECNTMKFDITLSASYQCFGNSDQYERLMKYASHEKLKDFCRRIMMELFPDKISAITFTNIKELRGQITIYFDLKIN